MPTTQVMVSIAFTTEDPNSVESTVNGFTGLPEGAMVSTSVSSTVGGASGTVDSGGDIVPPEPPPEVVP